MGRAGQWVGQVAAGVLDIRPVSRVSIVHLTSQLRTESYGIVDCHFVPRIVTASRAEVAPLWGLGGGGSGKLSIAGGNKLGKMIYNRPGAQDSTVCGRNRKCKRCVVTEIPGTKSRPVFSIDPPLVPGASQRSH